jgi:hypothetical protein
MGMRRQDTQELYEPLERAIHELHSYKTPEIVATPIIAGSKSYLEWIKAETSALVLEGYEQQQLHHIPRPRRAMPLPPRGDLPYGARDRRAGS